MLDQLLPEAWASSFVVKLLIAGVLGAAIGQEREKRLPFSCWSLIHVQVSHTKKSSPNSANVLGSGSSRSHFSTNASASSLRALPVECHGRPGSPVTRKYQIGPLRSLRL